MISSNPDKLFLWYNSIQQTLTKRLEFRTLTHFNIWTNNMLKHNSQYSMWMFVFHMWCDVVTFNVSSIISYIQQNTTIKNKIREMFTFELIHFWWLCFTTVGIFRESDCFFKGHAWLNLYFKQPKNCMSSSLGLSTIGRIIIWHNLLLSLHKSIIVKLFRNNSIFFSNNTLW